MQNILTAIKAIPLDLTSNQSDISWTVRTQAGDAYQSIQLSDDTNSVVLFDVSKINSNSGVQYISQGHSNYDGNNLSLKVVCQQSNELKYKVTHSNILGDKSAPIGTCYTIIFEDSTDNDYRDLVVNIMSINRINK